MVEVESLTKKRRRATKYIHELYDKNAKLNAQLSDEMHEIHQDFTIGMPSLVHNSMMRLKIENRKSKEHTEMTICRF